MKGMWKTLCYGLEKSRPLQLYVESLVQYCRSGKTKNAEGNKDRAVRAPAALQSHLWNNTLRIKVPTCKILNIFARRNWTKIAAEGVLCWKATVWQVFPIVQPRRHISLQLLGKGQAEYIMSVPAYCAGLTIKMQECGGHKHSPTFRKAAEVGQGVEVRLPAGEPWQVNAGKWSREIKVAPVCRRSQGCARFTEKS